MQPANEPDQAVKKDGKAFDALFEQVSDAIMITDFKANFLEVNSSFCKMFGYTRDELLKMSVPQMFGPESSERPIRFDKIQAGEHLINERTMLHKDGHVILVRANVKKLNDEQIIAIATDVSEQTIERQKAREQLQREKELSDKVINSLPGIFYVRSMAGKYLRWNRNLENVLGYNEDELRNLKPGTLIHPDDWQKVVRAIEGVYKQGQSFVEARMVAKSGKVLHYFLTGTYIDYEGVPALLGTGIDITDRKQTEIELLHKNEQLSQLSSHLQTVREEERSHISREIHDELGQQLTSLKMLVNRLKNKDGADLDALNAKADNMIGIVDETIKTVRRIATELRPGILDDLGLEAAIEWLIREFGKTTGIQCRCKISNLKENYSKPICTTVFRIVQECLTNVSRHAQATLINVKLFERDNKLVLEFRDNGVGISEENMRNKRSLGLLGMQERAKMVGGECIIRPLASRGTFVSLKIPV